MNPRLAAFLDGLKSPRLRALFGAGALVVGFFVVVDLRLRNGAILGVPQERLLLGAHDQVTNTIYRLQALRANPPARAYYFFGGSSLRESLTSPAEFEKKLPKDVHVEVFGTRNQSFTEARVLVDQLPPVSPSHRAMVVLGVNPWRFSFEAKSLREELLSYWFVSPSEDFAKTIREHGGLEFWQAWAIPGAIRFASRYWKVHGDTLKHGKLPWTVFRYHIYGGERLPAEARNRLMDRVAQERLPGFEKNFGFHSRELSSLVKEIRAKGYFPVLVETPCHPLAQKRFGLMLKLYKTGIREISRNESLPYFDLGFRLEWTPGDFVDLSHLVPAGQARFETALAGALTKLGDTL